jgi:hypothetical protein
MGVASLLSHLLHLVPAEQVSDNDDDDYDDDDDDG